MKKRFYFVDAVLILLFIAFSAAPAPAGVVCHHCGEEIEGPHMQVDDRFFHPGHLICPLCNEPIQGSVAKEDGKYYHPECYKQKDLPKCDICGQAMEGRYLTDDWGMKYHEYHEKLMMRCTYCRRLVPGLPSFESPHFRDGRTVCDRCNSTAVRKEDEADELFRDVKAKVARYGFVFPDREIPVHLATASHLEDMMAKKGVNGVTHFKTVSRFGDQRTENVEIYILEGLPHFKFVEVAAHELCHAWIRLNDNHGLDEVFEEGSCQALAVMVLTGEKSPEAERAIADIEKNMDPVYGDGYRLAKQYIADTGVGGWLAYLSTKQSGAAAGGGDLSGILMGRYLLLFGVLAILLACLIVLRKKAKQALLS
ncbi:MAG TPA: protein DA1 [Dissulfurispiraceae bacterium]|nr:protein DA1 [Dissulfurispiraceae bacterium]